MRVNVEKVLERDEKLYEAERRAYELKVNKVLNLPSSWGGSPETMKS